MDGVNNSSLENHVVVVDSRKNQKCLSRRLDSLVAGDKCWGGVGKERMLEWDTTPVLSQTPECR